MAKIYRYFHEQSLKAQENITTKIRVAIDGLLPLWPTADAVQSHAATLSRKWPGAAYL